MKDKQTSGQIDGSDGRVFRWMLQGDSRPEIYGWIERDYKVEPDSGGFWRTDDPQQAAKRAWAAFPAARENAQ